MRALINSRIIIYGRSKTPTVSVLEERLASLEGGESSVTAGSGSQALFNLIFTIARPGDNVVTTLNTFGEGYKQAATIFPERCNVEFRFVKNFTDPKAWDQAIDKKTRLVWVETPSNPVLLVTDIAAIADVAHGRGVPLMVDNTTATAALQKPMDAGSRYHPAFADQVPEWQCQCSGRRNRWTRSIWSKISVGTRPNSSARSCSPLRPG